MRGGVGEGVGIKGAGDGGERVGGGVGAVYEPKAT